MKFLAAFLATLAVSQAAESTVRGNAARKLQQSNCSTFEEAICSTEGFAAICLAVSIAGVGSDLNKGNVTVFAPTNEAIRQLALNLPPQALSDIDLVKSVLMYHTVLDETLFSKDIECGSTLTMANAQETDVVCQGSNIFIEGEGNSDSDMPKVVETDIEFCNGVIHRIDGVLLPEMMDGAMTQEPAPSTGGAMDSPTMMPSMMESMTSAPTMMPSKMESSPDSSMNMPPSMMPSMMESSPSAMSSPTANGECSSIEDLACSSDGFKTLCKLVKAAGLGDASPGASGKFTVFAPNDKAFAAVPDATLDSLMQDNDALQNVLLYHVVVDETLYAKDLECSETVEMANGDDTRTVCRGDAIYQKGSGNTDDNMPMVVTADMKACDGVIHEIDMVLLP
ncbi:hypothetical protein MPSEU_000045800 [Mayamaea pseudoterrestris]|nr:hypothetical protein MPSEU_000045800 [Mayamaea pseudoterrestris]